MKVIIDRFEGDYAVVEMPNRRMIDLPIVLVPKGAREGDTLDISVDEDDTEKRRKRIEELTEDLWQ